MIKRIIAKILKKFLLSPSDLILFTAGAFLGIGVCFITGYKSEDSTVGRVEQQAIAKTDTIPKVNWGDIENSGFSMDFNKLGVVLIKRTFLDGEELTYVLFDDGNERHFYCSRSVHEKLVKEFEAYLLKKSGNDQ